MEATLQKPRGVLLYCGARAAELVARLALDDADPYLLNECI
jgi:hypothetical protein